MGINKGLFVSGDQMQKIFELKKLEIKMSSVLSVSNDSSKSEEFSFKDMEALVDSEEQNWSKRAHVETFLGLSHIDTAVDGLDKCEMLARNDIEATPHGTGVWSGPKDHQNKKDKFLSVFGVMYIIIKSQKDKGKALKKHILKDIVPGGFNAKIEEIQGKHRQTLKKKMLQLNCSMMI